MPPAAWLSEHHAYLQLMLELQARGDVDVVHNNSLHHLPVAMAAVAARPRWSPRCTPRRRRGSSRRSRSPTTTGPASWRSASTPRGVVAARRRRRGRAQRRRRRSGGDRARAATTLAWVGPPRAREGAAPGHRHRPCRRDAGCAWPARSATPTTSREMVAPRLGADVEYARAPRAPTSWPRSVGGSAATAGHARLGRALRPGRRRGHWPAAPRSSPSTAAACRSSWRRDVGGSSPRRRQRPPRHAVARRGHARPRRRAATTPCGTARWTDGRRLPARLRHDAGACEVAA